MGTDRRDGIEKGNVRMKLSKTQTKLVEQALRYDRHTVSAEVIQGRGPEGGRIDVGRRDMNALRKLVESGYAEQVKTSTHRDGRGGYGYTNVILTVRLTPEFVEAYREGRDDT